jgi:exodeoxyribonuclease VII small subunit
VDVVAEQIAQTTQVAQNGASADESRYEEIVQRLAKVVERLEGGGLSLEESIAAFEEGIRLARAGAAKLEEAERKVELLLENDRTAPFGTDDGSRR